MVPIASMSVESCTRGCWLLRDLRSTAGRLLLGACFATCTRRFCGCGSCACEQNYWLVIVGFCGGGATRFVTHFGCGNEFCVMASWRKPATEVAAT